jgi:hypothetical protein
MALREADQKGSFGWGGVEVEFLDDLGMQEGVPLGLARDGLEEADVDVGAILALADAEEVHDIATA